MVVPTEAADNLLVCDSVLTLVRSTMQYRNKEHHHEQYTACGDGACIDPYLSCNLSCNSRLELAGCHCILVVVVTVDLGPFP